MRSDPDERAAFNIVTRALEAPFRALLINAGYDPALYLAEIDGTGAGFDVEKGAIVNLLQAGIVDPAGVVQSAARIALSGAALALTTDVLVQHRKRAESLEP